MARNASSGRGRPAYPDGRAAQNRTLIAHAAAKLIAEHGITDWSLAKRKAARQLMLPEREALPGDDEVEAALADYHALFGGDAHVETLRAQRELALRWMRRLADFQPLLTGGVAEGWATEHSDVRLELTASDAKLVEMALLNHDVPYRAMNVDRDGAAELYIDEREGGVRLSIRDPAQARQRPQRDRHGNEEVRLTASELGALLTASAKGVRGGGG